MCEAEKTNSRKMQLNFLSLIKTFNEHRNGFLD